MISLQREGAVFVLRMTGGENRLNEPFLRDVNQALDEVERSEGDAALVTTGEGKFYSNGLDLEALQGGAVKDPQAMLAGVHRLLARLLTFPVATVAAVNGHAFAAGAMLALAQDFRIMRADRGYLCLPEIDLGTGRPLTPGMYALIGARLSPAVFHEALITGKRYSASDAVAAQFVHEARAEADVLPRSLELAQTLIGKDRATMAALKSGLFASAVEALGGAVETSAT